MNCEFLRSHGLLTAGFLIASFPAQSALITFSDRAVFESAATGLTNVTFEGIAPSGSSMSFPNPDGLTTAGITFRTSGTGSSSVAVYAASAAAQSPLLNTGTGAILSWAPPGQPGTVFLDVLLPGGKTAFATDLWAQQPFQTTVQATVNSGEATENFSINTVNRPTPSFFGVVSDSNTVLLVRFGVPAGQAGLILDNVSVGTAGSGGGAVPEPGAIALLGAGLVAIAILRKFKISRRFTSAPQ